MSRAEMIAWIESLPEDAREAAVEAQLGIDGDAGRSLPGEHMLPYHASGVDPVLRALAEVPVRADDVFIDIGCGRGKVVLLAAIVTGARARGVDVQPELIERARAAAARLGIDARFECADAREADLADGTVFYFYTPFTGPVFAAVLARLRRIAERRAIVVCALGFDITAPWLVRRELDHFWLTIYDSVIAGVAKGPR
jgi:SAM-dependent methyltransferase